MAAKICCPQCDPQHLGFRGRRRPNGVREQGLHFVDLEGWSLLAVPLRVDQAEVAQELDLPIGRCLARQYFAIVESCVICRFTVAGLSPIFCLPRDPHRSAALD